jgi:hypothetical protein
VVFEDTRALAAERNGRQTIEKLFPVVMYVTAIYLLPWKTLRVVRRRTDVIVHEIANTFRLFVCFAASVEKCWHSCTVTIKYEGTVLNRLITTRPVVALRLGAYW